MPTTPTSPIGRPVSLTKPPEDHANRDTAATKHLCAGVYFDRAFRDRVLRRVHGDPYHRVAPSFGFDLIPVVEHAWRSWLLDTAQQGIVLLVLVSGYAMNRPALVTVVCWLGLFYLARAMASAAPDAVRLRVRRLVDRLLNRTWRDRRQFKEEERLQRQTLVLRMGFVACLCLLVTSLVAAGWTGAPADGATAALWVLAPLAYAATMAAALRQASLNRMHNASVLRFDRLTRRQEVIDAQQSHTFVVYHRSDSESDSDETWDEFDPFERTPTIFVGSGQLVHRWLPPLVIQLLRPGNEDMREREYAEPPFRTHELIDHLRGTIRSASAPGDPRRLRMQVRDRVFLDEREVREERDFLTGRVGAKQLRKIIDNPHHAAQHFLEIRVSTSGELVTTVFLRATVRGRSLSLDFAACSLTRTPFDYQLLNLFAESGRGAVIRATLRALWRLPEETSQVFRLAGLPLTLGRAVLAVNDRTLLPRRRILIGTRYSLREERSLPWKDSRFDETGIHDEIKLVEQRLLKSAEDFLTTHKVDTSAFKKKADNIINNSGVLNMGGRLEMKNSAVGVQAQVQVQVPTPAGGAEQGGN